MPAKELAHWTLDKRIPIAVLLAILIQAAGIIYWGGSMAARLDKVEQWQYINGPVIQRIDRLEERVEGVKDTVNRMENKLDKMLQGQ